MQVYNDYQILIFFSLFDLRLQYLRMLAVAYEKTHDLARDLRAMGCGDLDIEGNELIIKINISLTSLVQLVIYC